MTIPTRLAYAAVFIGVLGHASSEFVAVLSGVSGPEASVWRYVLGGAGLVIWALLTPGSSDLLTPLRAEAARLVPLSLWGVAGAYLAFHWALDFASVAQVATIVATIPIFVAFSNWAINGQRPSPVKFATGALASLGVALLITDGALDQLAGDANSLFGVLLAIICAVLGATYAVMVKPIVQAHGALRITAVSMMIGGVALWLVVGAFWSIWVNPITLFDKPATQAWSLAALALWNTTITQVMWFGGLAAAPDITRASYIFFLKPVLAAALAFVFLAQGVSTLQALAILLVTGSVFVEMFWGRISGALGITRA